MQYLLAMLVTILLASCQTSNNPSVDTASLPAEPSSFSEAQKAQLDTATFAGGCFWCTEAVFERTKGVASVVSGYSGGTQPNPTYKAVSAGQTDYAEAVQVYYDPEVITYAELVKVFFGTMDPTQLNRQGPDVGEQYRSVVFHHGPEQEKIVQEYVVKLGTSGKYDKPIVTEIQPYEAFYEAEGYHQNYYEINPNDPYIRSIANPKVKKFKENFPKLVKEQYSS